MVIPESRLFCRLDGLTATARAQQRLSVLADLGLLEPTGVPVFEEAVQSAAQFLEAPIGLVTVLGPELEYVKAAVGLSHLGVMNPLARERQLAATDSFGAYVVDSHQVLAIRDTADHPALASGLLAQQYGIRAYLGVPLITASGDCLGVLAVMDLEPREFSLKDLEFLVLTARLCLSEYERRHLIKQQVALTAPVPTAASTSQSTSQNPIKFELLALLTQELRTPLTSVMGMASVLTREIYGPLTHKQKEYLDIIHTSGHYLLSLVKEILELSALDNSANSLNLVAVDIEMLCQQAISTLEQAASRREQQIRLTVEPGNRIWALDKEKIRQMLYHLMFSVVQASTAGSIVRLHVSHKSNGLKISVWVSHPHLGDSSYGDLYPSQVISAGSIVSDYAGADDLRSVVDQRGTATLAAPAVTPLDATAEAVQRNLGLLLSRQLAELHGGQVQIQGSTAPGYRYVVTLPRLNLPDGRLATGGHRAAQ
jgi:signal transduction histidine kinase